MRQALLDDSAAGTPRLTQVALMLMMAGLGFKLAAVPFHFYAPDVYEGTSNANAGLLAVAPKIAGSVALIRIIYYAFPVETTFAWQLPLILSLLTMTVGNVCALRQQNIRRLLAYSSIAHAGYMLIGFSVALAQRGSSDALAAEGLGAMVLYLSVYAVASAGTFAVLAALSDNDHEVDDICQLSGGAKSQPILAGCLALFMFSLSGLPPLAGFWGKLELLASALRTGLAESSATSFSSPWFVLVAIAAAVNAAIAAAYYLRIVATLYFQADTGTRGLDRRGGWGAHLAAVICAAAVVVVGLWPGRLASLTRQLSILSPTEVVAVDRLPGIVDEAINLSR
jgi:NADH-quinone oxidoreductase subunit N